MGAQTQGLSLTIQTLPLSYQVISSTTFHLKPTLVTHFPWPMKFIHEFPIFFHEKHTDLTTYPQLFMLGAKCNR